MCCYALLVTPRAHGVATNARVEVIAHLGATKCSGFHGVNYGYQLCKLSNEYLMIHPTDPLMRNHPSYSATLATGVMTCHNHLAQ